jgi:hypothetical protein
LFKRRTGSRRPAPTAEAEPDGPYPPRFWWLKRLTVSYVAFAALVGSAYGAWWAYSERRLAGTIAAIRARGEPAVLADFLRQEVLPVEQNGAVALEAAAKTGW